jgi:Uma2 family endonuclease
MGMPHPSGDWTADMVRLLPDDGNRYEVVGGQLLVTPAPSWRHGDAVSAMHLVLYQYCHEHRLGHVKIAPQDVEFDQRNMVEPDLFVVPLINGAKPLEWEDVRRLLLAIEVLSPGTARHDRFTKRRLFQAQGVPEYWIVDVNTRMVERWRPGDERPELLADTLDWQPDPEVSPLAIDLPAYFADVFGESPDIAR